MIVRSYSPDLGRQVRAARDEEVWRDLARDLTRPPLVRRVDRGPQERDRQRLDARVDQVLHRAAHLVLDERDDHVAVDVDALGDRADELRRDEGGRLVGLRDVEGLLAGQARRAAGALHDEDHTVVPARGEQTDPGTAPLDDRVRAGGRPMDQARAVLQQRAKVDLQHVRGSLDRVEEPARAIVRGGWRLPGHNVPLGVHHDAVGEGAADVDTDHVRGAAEGHAFTSSIRTSRTGGSSGRHSSVARLSPHDEQRYCRIT